MDGFVYEHKKQRCRMKYILVLEPSSNNVEYLVASGSSTMRNIRKLMYAAIQTML